MKNSIIILDIKFWSMLNACTSLEQLPLSLCNQACEPDYISTYNAD